MRLLKECGLLMKSTDIDHAMKIAERSKTPIKFLITDQWFVRIQSDPSQTAGETETKQKQPMRTRIAETSKEIAWYLPHFEIKLHDWNNKAHDWCFSRQRAFGIPFPVWYSLRKSEKGKILLPSAERLRSGCARTVPSTQSSSSLKATRTTRCKRIRT